MKKIDRYLEEIQTTINQVPVEQIEEIISILHNARMKRKQVFILGNGGSASTASHFVCDLAKNTRKNSLPGFRVIGLTDNMAMFSAYANDDGYHNVFSLQLSNLMQPEDIVIAISGSGNSPNVLQAVEYANLHGAVTIGFTGITGGMLKNIVKVGIHVQNDHMDQVEDIHLMLEHVICRSLLETEAPEDEREVEIMQLAAFSPETDDLVNELFSKSLPMVQSSNKNRDTDTPSQDLLSKISVEFATKLDLHDLLARILCLTVESVGAVGGSIVVLDETGEVIDGAMAYAGQIREQSPDHLNETIQHGLAGWVLENRAPALIENTKEDPRWLPRGWETTLDLSRSAICVPLLTQERVLGVLTLTRLQSNRFTMEDLSLLTTVTLALSYSFNAKTGAANKR